MRCHATLGQPPLSIFNRQHALSPPPLLSHCRYNPIGAEGAKALAEILKYGMAVEVLKLGWCKIGGGEGAKAVADLVMFNSTLRTLDVRGNSFGNDGKGKHGDGGVDLKG